MQKHKVIFFILIIPGLIFHIIFENNTYAANFSHLGILPGCIFLMATAGYFAWRSIKANSVAIIWAMGYIIILVIQISLKVLKISWPALSASIPSLYNRFCIFALNPIIFLICFLVYKIFGKGEKMATRNEPLQLKK